ncbi:hypothetical protein RRF57_010501 [Xylaria bambusicola]|uniref:Uncharacterized protein n=1 Tax=Xylaria bambusicola TaxID=326684 RepID=A0AAN7UWQ5_9PEZI
MPLTALVDGYVFESLQHLFGVNIEELRLDGARVVVNEADLRRTPGDALNAKSDERREMSAELLYRDGKRREIVAVDLIFVAAASHADNATEA